MSTDNSWKPPRLDSNLQPDRPGLSNPNVPGLKVYNSLTKSKVDFISKEPNKITWYNCGPTVYDASHMGHARNYVTQDILRRIARDYFKYDVKFVMNVTDIDDKIIQRARQQHLLENLRSKHDKLTIELIDLVQASFEAYFKTTMGKLLGHEWPFEKILQTANADPKWKAEMLGKEEKFGLWLESLGTAREALEQASSTLEQPPHNTKSSVEQLIHGASEVLSKWLDHQYGSTITDHAIFKKLAGFWEKSFFDDMAILGVEPPTVLTRVSDYVDEIVQFVKKIIHRGFAYEHDGSIYFDVNAFDGSKVDDHPSHEPFFHCYAKLQPGSKSNKKLMEEGEGALSVYSTNTASGGKRSPADFALWKKSKPGEPGWDSEWGSGRPGWHIECSVMASAILGDGMDIHSGGVDLMFPHHDNEMAQSEAYHNCPQWVNYFLHTGHLHIEGLKMSKSLKNFITISDALKQHSPRQLRLSFIVQRWDLGMDFAESAMAEVRNQESTFNNFFAVVKALRYEQSVETMMESIDLVEFDMDGSSHPLAAVFKGTQSDFHAALCDSFNTPEAMRQLLTLVTETNKFISSHIPAVRSELDRQSLVIISKIAGWITHQLRIFGLVEQGPNGPVHDVNSGSLADDRIGWNLCNSAEPTVMKYLLQWSSFRDQARKIAREKMQKKDSSVPLGQELIRLCDQQFLDHLGQLGIPHSAHPDSSTFFSNLNSAVGHLGEPIRKSLMSYLLIWYDFWNELYQLSQSSRIGPKDVLTACDRLRDEKLIEVGVALDDQDDGKALVKLLPASILIQAREEKQRILRDKERKIRELNEENERKRIEKILKGKLKPSEMFLNMKEYSKFDENGIPTHMSENGEEVSKSKRKKLVKDWEVQKKLHQDYLAWEESQKPKGSS